MHYVSQTAATITRVTDLMPLPSSTLTYATDDLRYDELRLTLSRAQVSLIRRNNATDLSDDLAHDTLRRRAGDHPLVLPLTINLRVFACVVPAGLQLDPAVPTSKIDCHILPLRVVASPDRIRELMLFPPAIAAALATEAADTAIDDDGDNNNNNDGNGNDDAQRKPVSGEQKDALESGSVDGDDDGADDASSDSATHNMNVSMHDADRAVMCGDVTLAARVRLRGTSI